VTPLVKIMPHTIVPFISIKKAKKDATFSIDEDFRNDSSDRKVNLSVGAYKSEEGKAVILKSVKQAEQKVLEGETNKDYLPMSGLKSFTEGARQVLFSGSVESSKIASIQTLSGTGALRVGFEFLAGFGRKVAYVPQQTWANHHAIIKAAGLELREYKYLDTENMRLDFEGMMDDLRMAPAGSVVVLHMCGHNPTGQDLNEREWEEVHALMEERSLLPFFDAAYQGFTSGDLDRDAYSLRLFASAGPTELLVAQSFSKNMGLYGERAGCLHIVVPDEAATVPVHSQASLVARRIWSNPPMHGAKIAAEIFSNDDLLRLWKSEVEVRAKVQGVAAQLFFT